jgi:hypothetical protein
VKIISGKTLTAFAGTVALAAVLGACSSVTVNTDWNSSLDFTQYKTFAWLPDTVDTELEPFAQERLTTAITAELVKHGLTQVKSDPQLYVTFRAKRHAETRYTTVSTGYGYGAGWGGWGGYGYGYPGYGGVGVSTTSAQQIPMGNLIVVLVDPKLNQMVWRSNAKAELADDAAGRAQQLQQAMAQMFQQFPPKKGQVPGASEY